MATVSIAAALDAPYALTSQQVASYRERGFVRLPHVLPAALLDSYRDDIARLIAEFRAHRPPLEERSTYDKAFLQMTNLWRSSDRVREFVYGKRLARIAAELMGVAGVRLYHDQALFKEPGGGFTPWHADQFYWPVSNDNVITAWIPLVEVTMDMGPLAFAAGSHRLRDGRDLAISDESEAGLKARLQAFPLEQAPFALGDVSFHSGWTFHRAGANETGRMREVFTIIFMDQDIRLIEPRHDNHRADREAFAPGIEVGEVIASPLNPVLYAEAE